MKTTTVIESFEQDLLVSHGRSVYARATKNASAFSFWMSISVDSTSKVDDKLSSILQLHIKD